VKRGLKFHVVKYLFLALYLGLLAGVFLRVFVKAKSDLAAFAVLAAVFVVTLVLAFLPIAPVKIGFYRNRAPAALSLAAFSLMAGVLLLGVHLAPSEFFGGTYGRAISSVFEDKHVLFVIGGVWIVLFVLGLLLTWGRDPGTVYKRTLAGLLAGSVLELVIAVPLHLMVTKRGGCFAGITSMLGVSAGILVLLWALGPALFLIGLHYYGKLKK
jgi:hypothetical protein